MSSPCESLIRMTRRRSSGTSGNGSARSGSTSVRTCVAAGGRYDGLVGMFSGKDVPVASAKATAPSAKGTSYAAGVVQRVSQGGGRQRLRLHLRLRLRSARQPTTRASYPALHLCPNLGVARNIT